MAKVQGPFSTTNAQKKSAIISMLRKEGYNTYADRLEGFKFIAADTYMGQAIVVAVCFTTRGIIVINPGFFPDGLPVPAVSVIVRHELLHALLAHEARLADYLRQKYPQDFQWLKRVGTIHEIANYAMDYDISNEGYDDFDKQIVRTLTLNGRFLGGLISEDDHPEWVDQQLGRVVKTMEEMYTELLGDTVEQLRAIKQSGGNPNAPTAPTVELDQKPQQYVDTYNEVIAQCNTAQYSDEDLQMLIARLQAGEDLFV